MRVIGGGFLANADDVANVVLDVRDGPWCRWATWPRVMDGPAEVDSYTFHGTPGEVLSPDGDRRGVQAPGGRRHGGGAARWSTRSSGSRAGSCPRMSIRSCTRNYGETARHKVVTLQEHLVLAVIAVGIVVAVIMGWRSAVVVMLAVPITFALTLFVYQIFGYTLNRVTLFALIFVTGIVIDDSIIVAENMERHFKMKDRPLRAAASAAVDEVGNPTILATLTVIAAVLPMLFVVGPHGAVHEPDARSGRTRGHAVLAWRWPSSVTPWLAFRLLGRGTPRTRATSPYVAGGDPDLPGLRVGSCDRSSPPARPWSARWPWSAVLLVGATGLFVTRSVVVKMLPFDDKNEVQVILDLPEGTPLEATLALAPDVAARLGAVPEVADVQLYAGVAAPFNFNGMIRHYYLRQGPNVADLQVNLVDKWERKREEPRHRPGCPPHRGGGGGRLGHRGAGQGRGGAARARRSCRRWSPRSTATTRRPSVRVAEQVMDRFAEHPGVVDVDWSLDRRPRASCASRWTPRRRRCPAWPRSRSCGALAVGLGGPVVSARLGARVAGPGAGAGPAARGGAIGRRTATRGPARGLPIRRHGARRGAGRRSRRSPSPRWSTARTASR